jgi:hypothetical protein
VFGVKYDKACGQLSLLCKQIAKENFPDLACLAIYRLLNDCLGTSRQCAFVTSHRFLACARCVCVRICESGVTKEGELKQMESLYQAVLSVLSPPAKPHVFESLPKEPERKAEKPANKESKEEKKSDSMDLDSDSAKKDKKKEEDVKDVEMKDNDDKDEKDSGTGTGTKDGELKVPDQRETLWFGMTSELAKLYLKLKQYDRVKDSITALSKAFPSVYQNITILSLELSVCVETKDDRGAKSVLDRAEALVGDDAKVHLMCKCVVWY